MPRRRTVRITETIEELRQLKEHYTGTPKEEAIHLLMLLKGDERRTIDHCAQTVGFSTRKAERIWKRYREVGLSGVVGSDIGGAEVDTEAVVGGRVTEKSSRYVASPDWRSATGEDKIGIAGLLFRSADIESQFDNVEWVKSMRRLLQEILLSVSYIVVNVVNATILDGVSHRGVLRDSIRPDGANFLVVQVQEEFSSHAERLLTDATRFGVNLDRYAIPPYSVDVHFETEESRVEGRVGSYLGSILFFGLKSHVPGEDSTGVSTEDRNLIELLKPYLTLIFANYLKRTSKRKTLRTDVIDSVHQLSKTANLTNAESRLFWLLLSGKRDAELAIDLSIAVSTVRSHVGSILRKTGARDRIDLLSRLFTLEGIIPELSRSRRGGT